MQQIYQIIIHACWLICYCGQLLIDISEKPILPQRYYIAINVILDPKLLREYIGLKETLGKLETYYPSELRIKPAIIRAHTQTRTNTRISFHIARIMHGQKIPWFVIRKIIHHHYISVSNFPVTKQILSYYIYMRLVIVVVPGESIKCPQLLPSLTQTGCTVVKISTNISSNLVQ